MSVYGRIARPVLYRMDPELAHERTLRWLSRRGVTAALRRIYGRIPPTAERTVFGIRFPSPVGVAAGMDKNGIALPAWRALGFGFVEAGTVTAHPQPGNPRPRLFRLVESRAVINRMGFNNLGSQALADRLDEYGDLGFPIGISIGKSKITPLSEAVEDYVVSLRRLHPYGAYFAVNVSSPNTPGLRSLQDGGLLRELLTALRSESPQKPLLVKIAPDLTDPAIDDVLQVCTDTGVAGIIATNTTTGRDGLAASDQALGSESGGLSGRPLTSRALDVVSYIHRHTDLPIIGVGGILTPDDAFRMFEAGASLVQLYTGLIYTGPTLIHHINRRFGG